MNVGKLGRAGAWRPAAAALAALVTASGGLAVTAPPAAALTATVTPAGSARTVTLINGDRLAVAVSPSGVAAATAGGAGGLASALIRLRLAGQAYEIPADALPYLNRGLSPDLFDLGPLLRAEAGGRLPVRVSYRGALPALPGVRITRSGGGIAQGYLTAASAPAFGAALARQFAADHRRGSYGTDGMFAGAVSIGLPGAAAPTRPDFPMHTLTVTGTDLAGQPDTGDVVGVFNVDNLLKFGDPIETSNVFDQGVAKFSVPAGHYMAIGLFFDITAAGPTGMRVVTLPQFTVAGDTTVAVNEPTATSEVAMVTPRPAVVRDITFGITRLTAHGDLIEDAVDAGNLPVWTNVTTTPVTVGTLHAAATGYLTARAGGPRYEYDLAFAGPSGLIGPQRYVVTPASLATVRAGYFQQGKSVGGWAPSSIFGFDITGGIAILFADIFPFGLPRTGTQYFSAGPALYWFNQYWQSFATLSGGQSDAARAFTPGEVTSQDWNAGPLHPGPNVNLLGPGNPLPALSSASRAGNTLTLWITPFSDNTPGHTGTGFLSGVFGGPPVTGRYQLDQNGKKIAAGTAATGPPDLILQARLSPRPATLRLALTTARTGYLYQLSPATSTVWTWRTARRPGARLPAGWLCADLTRTCAVQPMMTLLYRVRALATNGSARTGRQLVGVTAGHLQLARAAAITGLTAQVSVNDGRTWRAVPVRPAGGTRFDVTFNAPPGSYVSLRVHAADAAGGQITETVIRAYRIAP
ncbi:MAG TPA: hypothetical protein VMI33_22165 [Streptosporangiaceae bacterium]|nr:hypothetical protein [Streptosporangiaceae bacterium]